MRARAVTESEVHQLWKVFLSVDADHSGFISEEELMLLPQLAFNPLGKRVVAAAFEGHKKRAASRKAEEAAADGAGPSSLDSKDLESGGDNMELNFRDFVRVLSPFAPNASAETK